MKKGIWTLALGLSAFGSAQELWHTGAPAEVYGIYFMVPINVPTVGGRGVELLDDRRRVQFDAPNMNVKSKSERMVGRIDAKVKDVVYNEMACKYYDTSYFVEAPRVTGMKNLRRRIESWVDFKGVMRRVRTFFEDERNRVMIDAQFEKDTIEMDIDENGKKRKMSMNPILGVASFNCPIPEMIKNATTDRKERVWCTIDPASGGIIQYTLRLKGRFVPPAGSSSKIKGWTFEVKAPSGVHSMHVSEDGQMRQIDFADTSVVRAVSINPLDGG